VDEASAILVRLTESSRTLTLAAALTGLRRGELFGLQWHDGDFADNVLHVGFSLVEQIAGKLKTEGSNRPLPLNGELSKSLALQKEQTLYAEPGDWVFASPASRGKQRIGRIPC
jgi:integrase